MDPNRPDARGVVAVIPAYNAGRTLNATLASIAAQTQPPTSVIVVDDCSTDDTATVARKWDGKLPLQVVQFPMNRQPAAARREAIRITKEPLIALLDSDDVWLPDHLEVLAQMHDAKGVLITSDALIWTPGNGVRKHTYRDRNPVPTKERQRVEILLRNFVCIGALFSRSDYEEAGGFRDGYLGAEDWDLWIRMLRMGVEVVPTPGPTMVIRRGETNLSVRPDIYDHYVDVLETAATEVGTDAERKAVAKSLKWTRSKKALVDAYAYVNQGDMELARAAAGDAMRMGGTVQQKAEASLLWAMPSLGARFASAARHLRE